MVRVNRRKRSQLKPMLGNETCSECGIGTTWNNKPLVLPIDHIDGNRFNDEKSNLRYLCPNCHSQTPTFAGKGSRKPRVENIAICRACDKTFTYITIGPAKTRNTRKACSQKCTIQLLMQYPGKYKHSPKIDWPTVEELRLLIQTHNYTGAAKLLGVSDVAIHKHLKKQS
jgi:hypothetical protein